MKRTAALVYLSLSLLVPSEAAMAKGCIKGAIIGGVASATCPKGLKGDGCQGAHGVGQAPRDLAN
jgi:hypothetical protein